MDKVAIVTDSNSGITLDEAKRLGIRVVPMPFLIDGKTYYEEISLSQEEFFKRLEEDVDISTSQPAPVSVTDIWDEELKMQKRLYIYLCQAVCQAHAILRQCCQKTIMGKCRWWITSVFLLHNGSLCLMQ